MEARIISITEPPPRQRHYKNFAGESGLAFVTTTALDFAFVFAPYKMRSIMVGSLIDDHLHYGAALHAFVVMPHHVHFITRVPEDKDLHWWMNRVKSNSAKRILPHLDQKQLQALAAQRGLGGRTFWMRSYRSIPIAEPRRYWSCRRYIHLNPYRAGLVDCPEDYRWSSAGALEEGRYGDWDGLLLDERYVRRFATESELALKGRDS